MSGRRRKKLQVAFRKLQEAAPGIEKGRFRAFKRAWTSRTSFSLPGGEAFLRGKP